MKLDKKFSLKHQKIINKLDPATLNKEILFHINEARTSPLDFSRHLMYSDDVEQEIQEVSIFFKSYHKKTLPLINDQNLEICAEDLIHKFRTIDNGLSMQNLIKNEKEKNSLKVRLKQIGLEPTYYKELIIMGTTAPIKAVANLFLKKKYREVLLNPKINYIGIASGILPSERIIIVVDLVQSLIIDENYSNITDNKEINYNLNKSNEKQKKINFEEHVRINDFSETKDSIGIINDNEENLNLNNYSIDKNKSKYNIENINFNNSNSRTENFWYNDPHVKHYVPKKEIIYKVNTETNSKLNKFLKMKNYFLNDANNYKKFSSKSTNHFKLNNKRIRYLESIGFNKKYIPETYNNYKEKNFCEKKSLTPIYIKDKKKSKIIVGEKYEFAKPISVSIERTMKICDNGQRIPVYSKQTLFDDGSLLIQPL